MVHSGARLKLLNLTASYGKGTPAGRMWCIQVHLINSEIETQMATKVV